MTEERLKSPRARMFVALDIPEGVRSAIAGWGREALVDPALRVVTAESLHVTLAFLGQTAETEVGRIATAIEGSAGPAPLIELLDPVARPERGRARLFALPVVSPGAEQIQARLTEMLVAERLYKAEKRPFWPHITVARVRPEGRGSRRPSPVREPPRGLSTGLTEAFYGVRMTLYRSELQPQGAHYVPLAQVELPGGGQQ
ncbi:MAG TPA: RNA 2',3'-cyclic phosphodiesterase [Solirubrobacterales bacterium]|nr:RNA 2',3'-cyclic phosphodiesterase [Solirubrobacterales bacterium]